MLAVEPFLASEQLLCDCCRKTIFAGIHGLDVYSDVDAGRSAKICAPCFFHLKEDPETQENFDKMLKHRLPHEYKLQKAQQAILDKINTRKENTKCQPKNRTKKNAPKHRPADTTGSSSPAPAERRGSSPRREGTKCASSPTSSAAGRSRRSR